MLEVDVERAVRNRVRLSGAEHGEQRDERDE
jgi:hypothetical protein